MEWNTTWNDPLIEYLAPYHELMNEHLVCRIYHTERLVEVVGKDSAMGSS